MWLLLAAGVPDTRRPSARHLSELRFLYLEYAAPSTLKHEKHSRRGCGPSSKDSDDGDGDNEDNNVVFFFPKVITKFTKCYTQKNVAVILNSCRIEKKGKTANYMIYALCVNRSRVST